MNNVLKTFLNAGVIRAAASSPRGVLSLMCLIVGILALVLFQSSPDWAKLMVFAVILLGVFGFGYSIVKQPPAVSTDQPMSIKATRDFVLGRWEVEQVTPDMEVASYIEYFADATFKGKENRFVNGVGSRVSISGSWEFTGLSKAQFRLTVNYSNGASLNARFRVLDHDRIHNLDQNYVAIRTPV